MFCFYILFMHAYRTAGGRPPESSYHHIIPVDPYMEECLMRSSLEVSPPLQESQLDSLGELLGHSHFELN